MYNFTKPDIFEDTNQKMQPETLADKIRKAKPGEWIRLEVDPLGKQPHELGAKLDHGKPSVWRGLLDYFPRACLEVAVVSTVGAKKYAWKGWEQVPDGINRYGDALGRHLCKEAIEGPIDGDTGLLHAAQTAWNAMARLELILREREKNPS